MLIDKQHPAGLQEYEVQWCVFVVCKPDVIYQLTQNLFFNMKKHGQWICKEDY